MYTPSCASLAPSCNRCMLLRWHTSQSETFPPLGIAVPTNYLKRRIRFRKGTRVCAAQHRQTSTLPCAHTHTHTHTHSPISAYPGYNPSSSVSSSSVGGEGCFFGIELRVAGLLKGSDLTGGGPSLAAPSSSAARATAGVELAVSDELSCRPLFLLSSSDSVSSADSRSGVAARPWTISSSLSCSTLGLSSSMASLSAPLVAFAGALRLDARDVPGFRVLESARDVWMAEATWRENVPMLREGLTNL